MLVLLALLGCRSPEVVEPLDDTGAATGGEVGDDGSGGGTGEDDTGGGETGGGESGGESGDDGGSDDLPALFVNELMAANEGSYPGPEDLDPDWIELYNAGSETVELGGLTMSDDYEEPDLHVLPDSLSIEAGGTLVLLANGADDPDEIELPFKLSAAGEGLGIFTADGEPIDWITFGSLSGDEATARIPDGGEDWVVMPVGTPGESNRVLAWQELEPVESGATWAYEDSGTDLGTEWREPEYDDEDWAAGPAPLGYGDSRESTTLSYGADSANKNPTTYLRLRFELEEVPTDADLRLMVDDGAIVWLNGTEVVRSNLTDGDVTYGTYAESAMSGSNETSFASYSVDSENFVAGENVLAVEVHQATPDSSDLGFDLTLEVQLLTDPE